jgi:FkbM family methyltransferase
MIGESIHLTKSLQGRPPGIVIVRLIKKFFTTLGFEIHKIHKRSIQHPPSFRGQIYESSKGILHVGGHRGQEAPAYAKAKAKVLWIEALESAFAELETVIKNFPGQEAINVLVGDEEKTVNFHIASNDGMSSSIFGFAKENGYDLSMSETVQLEMKRLDSLLSAEEAKNYPHWVVDVQGAELSVLRGAGQLLASCQTLDVEVSTFGVYEGGVSFAELDEFLRSEGFIPLWQPLERIHEDLLYVRTRPSSKEHSGFA